MPASWTRLRGWSAHAVVPAALGLDLLLWGGDGTGRWGLHLPTPLVVVATTVAFGALLARRRHPGASYGVVWVHAVVLSLVLPTYQPVAGLLVALYWFARHRPLRQVLPALAATTVPVGIGTYDTVSNTGTGAFGAAVTVLLWGVVFGAVWLTGRFAWGVQVTADLQRDNLAMEAELALAQQRTALARDLHDVVAHAVTLIVLQAGGARRLPAGDPRLADALATIEGTGSEAMRELRELLRVLSPQPAPAMAFDDLPVAHLSRAHHEGAHHAGADHPGGGTVPPCVPVALGLAALPALVERFRLTGMAVSLESGGVPSLPPPVDEVALRVVREALTNAVKHAGRGVRCEVSLRHLDGHLVVSVCDDGSGAPPPVGAVGSSGLGLSGLRARVSELGGELVAHPLPDGGYRVHASIPTTTSRSPTTVGRPVVPA